jgi:hypothetical protein
VGRTHLAITVELVHWIAPGTPAPDEMSDLPPILPWWGPRPSRARQATPASREVTEIRYRDLIT